MTGDPKVHLRGRGWRSSRRAACGLRNPRIHTATPDDVTCEGCAKTVFMADARYLAMTRPNRKRVQSG